MESSVFGAGRMARLVNEFNWAATSLGPIRSWPPELKTIVRHILESQFPAAVVWGPEMITIYNDAFHPILGAKPEALGRSFADVWAEAWHEIGPIAERAYAGQATYIEDFPLVIERGGTPEQAWFTFCYSPLRLSNGSVAGMIDTVVETTRTMQAKAKLDLLNNELAHRLKNTLAIVQAIAMQTLGTDADGGAVAAFRERISALSQAHELLDPNWASASLAMVIAQTLAPLDGLQQVTTEGPDISVGSHAALMLSLIIHELATNAAKYGALLVPDGRLTVSWTANDEMLRLSWLESGGPPVEQPVRRGFGSRLIERGLGSNCRVDFRFEPTGLKLEMEVPISDLADR
jgi:two-component sensor histidine kinase